MIAPGAYLGLLGGGQLGRMFTVAAQGMGYRVMVLDPGTESPAGSVADHHVRAGYLDRAGLAELGDACAAVTTEFENVPAEALDHLARTCIVSPAAASVAVAQDRIREKRFLTANGLGTAPFAVIERRDDLGPGLDPRLLPGILKRSRFGYDGKGQSRVQTREEALAAFIGMGEEPCVLEQLLPLDVEVSVVVVRGFDGAVSTFPVAENIHAQGILDVSIVPARVRPGVAAQAREAAVTVAEKLDYRGVLCVEFFVVASDRLLANEIAPRPHNSGHYSIDACFTSQFEQQVRVMAKLPLGDTALHCPAVMVNILGDAWHAGEPKWASVLTHPRVKLHLYGKRDPRPGRKMGHFTVLGDDVEANLELALDVKRTLLAPVSPAIDEALQGMA
ncbi:MAG: 5-(carboxyamino)imidazole ribonucleotide synthase [Burkholderiales bacterium]